jgi:hypothetical protein
MPACTGWCDVNPAPIALFVFNRPQHTRKMLEALRADPLAVSSDLFIFSDGAKREEDRARVLEVRALLHELSGFRSVVVREAEVNLGLAASVISGVTQILNHQTRVIVLEDDLKIVPGCLSYLNSGLEFYSGDSRVFSLSAWAPQIKLPENFSHDIYLSARGLCWGWATWKDRWEKVDWEVRDYAEFSRDAEALCAFSEVGEDLPDMLRDAMAGRNSSWAVKWAYAQFKLNAFCVVPVRSFVANIGQDESGTHSSVEVQHRAASLATANSSPRLEKVEPFPPILREFRKFYGYNWKGKLKKRFGLL